MTGVVRPLCTAKYSSRCMLDCAALGSDGAPLPDTTTLRGLGTAIASGTYSLRLRVLEWVPACSVLFMVATVVLFSEVRGLRPWYALRFGGEEFTTLPSVVGGTKKSVFDVAVEAAEDARDLDGNPHFHRSLPSPMGDGKGVKSSIAASCGEEMADPGDNEPAVP